MFICIARLIRSGTLVIENTQFHILDPDHAKLEYTHVIKELSYVEENHAKTNDMERCNGTL